MTTDFTKLPIIDLSVLAKNGNKDEMKVLARQVREIFETVGFAYIVNHQVSVKHGKVLELAKTFFDLPTLSKMKLAKKTFVGSNHNTYRGYFPLQIGDSYKEGFEIGPFNDKKLLKNGNKSGEKFNLLESNVWPDDSELPNFQKEVTDYYQQCLQLGDQMMRLIAISFDLDEFYFCRFFNETVSTLRLLHYPERSEQTNSLSCSEHTDSGILTLLVQDATGGLEIKNSSGDWIAAPFVQESLVVNVGDLMNRWTNGKFVATCHRVRAVQQQRFSVPFFFEPNLDAVIQPLEVCSDSGAKFDTVSYGDFVKSKMSGWVEYRDERIEFVWQQIIY